MTDKSAEEVLLRKKATTDGGCVLEILQSGIVGLPCARTKMRNSPDNWKILNLEEFKETIPSGRMSDNNILVDFSEDRSFDGERFEKRKNEFVRESTIKDDLEGIGTRTLRIDSISIKIVPGIGLNVENDVGEEWSVFFNPFEHSRPHDVFKEVHSQKPLKLNVEDGYNIEISGEEIDVDVWKNNSDIKECPDSEKLGVLVDGCIESQYDGWISVQVCDDSPSLTDEEEKFKIDIPELEINWIFDNPEVWNEDENIVGLVEKFAHGDPNNLDRVLIKPMHAIDEDESDTKIAENENGSWGLALEKPTNTQQDGESVFSRIFQF